MERICHRGFSVDFSLPLCPPISHPGGLVLWPPVSPGAGIKCAGLSFIRGGRSGVWGGDSRSRHRGSQNTCGIAY